jgi:hypothetical protein
MLSRVVWEALEHEANNPVAMLDGVLAVSMLSPFRTRVSFSQDGHDKLAGDICVTEQSINPYQSADLSTSPRVVFLNPFRSRKDKLHS